ncbi:MAG: Ig-like domain-containing protein, partial [Myxococcaceae bacterium]
MTGALRRSFLVVLAAVLSGALSCGSGIVVAVSPAEFTLQLGGSLTFVAKVTGANDTKVTWSIDEGDAGGTVSPEGLYLPTAPGEFHVRATSVADRGKSGAAVVKVNPIPPIEVTLTPVTATLTTGGRQTFTAVVSGTSIPTVSWRVEEAAGGSVTTGGTYTAPMVEGTYHLVATADADPNKTARADLVVVATPSVSVAVSPDTITLSRYSSTTLTAQVSGTTNTAVNWSLVENCTGCSISTGGLYRAGSQSGTYHAMATSVADPSKSAQATIIVPPAGGISVSVSPTSATLATLASRQFSAYVSGATNTQVSWTVVEGASGGTISSTGYYTAPDVPGSYRVSAISLADPSRRGYATVNVTSNFNVSITPSNTSVGPGGTATFSAVVTGTTNQAVTWSVVEPAGGTVTSTGTSTASYTAPASVGTYHVVARSQADTTRSATATVTVQAGILSGTVSYAGASTGRVYIVASDASGTALSGTSLAAPGIYSLRGIRTSGTLTVKAFMDVPGTGAANEAADPAG